MDVEYALVHPQLYVDDGDALSAASIKPDLIIEPQIIVEPAAA
jgi:hypothetical protein